MILSEEININNTTRQLTSFLDKSCEIISDEKTNSRTSTRRIGTSEEERVVVGENVVGEDVFGLFSCNTGMEKTKNVYILRILERLRHDLVWKDETVLPLYFGLRH